MSQLRKYAIVFLLLLNALPILMSFLFSLHQLWIRHEMLEKLEWEELHSITISLQDLQWEEEGRELMIDGRMFDVKSMQVIGNNVMLMGLFDDEETSLFQQIEDWHKDSGDDQLLTGLGQLFHNWQAEKHDQEILPWNGDFIPINHTAIEESVPPIPEQKGLIQPPDFMVC